MGEVTPLKSTRLKELENMRDAGLWAVFDSPPIDSLYRKKIYLVRDGATLSANWAELHVDAFATVL
jgi:hypothetical protein